MGRKKTRPGLKERELTRLILEYLRWALPGAWIRKNLGTLGQRRGIPDIEVIYRGTPYFLEVKTPGGRLSPYQEREIEALKEAGARVFVVTTLEEVHSIFKPERVSLFG
jgi:hypothetical protein